MKNVSYHGLGAVYCEVVIADDDLYLSGLISADLETGAIVCGTIEEETERILTNLKTILQRYGSDMDKCIRVEVFLTDFFGERDRMNEVYKKHFPADKMPARFCCGTNGLAGGCRIEVMVHAYR